MDIKKHTQTVVDAISADAAGDRQELIKALNGVAQNLSRLADMEFKSLAADSMAFAVENAEAFKNFKPKKSSTASERFLAAAKAAETAKE